MVASIIALIVIAYGGVVSRIHGGGIIAIRKVWTNLLWALPFGISTFLIYHVFFSLTLSVICGIICTLLTMVLKGTGHGQYFTLGHGVARGGSLVSDYDADDKPETLDPIVELMYGKETPENKTSRDFVGLTVVGAAAVLPMVLFLLPINLFLAIVLFIGGAAKSFAYLVGWTLFDRNEFPSPTNVGEVLTGIFAFLGLANALYYYM